MKFLAERNSGVCELEFYIEIMANLSCKSVNGSLAEQHQLLNKGYNDFITHRDEEINELSHVIRLDDSH